MAQAMILAAGRGERLRPHTDSCPKPLLRVHGKPLIEWQIEGLCRAGFDHIVVNGAWLADQLRDFLGDGSRWGVRLQWSPEAPALGTAGAVVRALRWLTDPLFAVVSADIFTDFDYRHLKRHCEQPPLGEPADRRSSWLAYLVLVEDARYPADFALDDSFRVQRSGLRTGTYGNIGVYRRDFFRALPKDSVLDLGPLLRQAVDRGEVEGEWAFGYWVNVGTVQEWERAQRLAFDRG